MASEDPNAAQREFWSGGPGQRWVAEADVFDAMHGNVLDLLLDAADPRPGERVLDVGCGAGGSTLAAAARVAPGGDATGLDISAPLLEVAERRRRAAGIDAAAFETGDAQGHALDGPYDLLISRFGVMFFADTAAAFAHLRRAMRTDGRLAVVCWAEAAANPWFAGPAAAAARVLGAHPAPSDPDGPGPMRFGDAGRLEALLAEAGWREVGHRTHATTLDYPGDADAVARFAAVTGPASRHLREAGADEMQTAAVTAAIREALAEHAEGDAVRVPATVHVVRAVA